MPNVAAGDGGRSPLPPSSKYTKDLTRAPSTSPGPRTRPAPGKAAGRPSAMLLDSFCVARKRASPGAAARVDFSGEAAGSDGACASPGGRGKSSGAANRVCAVRLASLLPLSQLFGLLVTAASFRTTRDDRWRLRLPVALPRPVACRHTDMLVNLGSAVPPFFTASRASRNCSTPAPIFAPRPALVSRPTAPIHRPIPQRLNWDTPHFPANGAALCDCGLGPNCRKSLYDLGDPLAARATRSDALRWASEAPCPNYVIVRAARQSPENSVRPLLACGVLAVARLVRSGAESARIVNPDPVNFPYGRLGRRLDGDDASDARAYVTRPKAPTAGQRADCMHLFRARCGWTPVREPCCSPGAFSSLNQASHAQWHCCTRASTRCMSSSAAMRVGSAPLTGVETAIPATPSPSTAPRTCSAAHGTGGAPIRRIPRRNLGSHVDHEWRLSRRLRHFWCPVDISADAQWC